MKSGLPEDLLLHPSGRSGLRPLGLQRDRSPGGSCSPLFSCAAEITKPHGAQGKARTSVGTAFPWAGSRAVWPCSGTGTALPQPPPGTLGPPRAGGCTPAFGKGTPAVRGAASGPLPSPGVAGCCAEEQGLRPGWPGRCTGTEVTPNLCPARPRLSHERVC